MASSINISIHDAGELGVTINPPHDRASSAWVDLRTPEGSEVTMFFRQDDMFSTSDALDVLVDFTERLHEEAVAVRDQVRAEILNEPDEEDVPCLHCGKPVVFSPGHNRWRHVADDGSETEACIASPDSESAEPHPEFLDRRSSNAQ